MCVLVNREDIVRRWFDIRFGCVFVEMWEEYFEGVFLILNGKVGYFEFKWYRIFVF